jgi:predicted aminopeptidase
VARNVKQKLLIAIAVASASTIALIAGTCLLAGCSNLGYYWQSVTGHLDVINRAKPVNEWLEKTDITEATRKKLELSQRIRAFASTELLLPDNASYRRFADLKRRSVVYNVVAAPPLSLQLKTWCFAVVGCVSYRGYYDEAAANQEAEQVKAQGYEVNVYGVPAYSTLGYLNWAGGDPLLSTFIHYPEGELARLVFHELAHQVLYVKDDTMFNESFATAVERLGGQRWLQTQASEATRKEYAEFDSRRLQFRALALRTRQALDEVFKQNQPLAGENNAQAAIKKIANETEQSAAKDKVMAQFRTQYEQLKTTWGGFNGYDAWVARANNASLGAMAAYDELVPAFEAVFDKNGRDFAKFYDAIKALVPLPYNERRQKLQELARG